MKKVFVFGSLNMDLVISSPYLPQEGETMYGSGFLTNPGGKGANQAAACGKLGAQVYMGGAVGGDSFGRTLLESLSSYGVKTGAVRVIPDRSSGIAVILVVDGDNRIILDSGANAEVTVADVDRLLETAEAGDVFLCPLENPLEIIGYAVKTAKAKGMYVILNPAPMDVAVKKYLPYCDMLVLNETEFAALCGSQLDTGGAELLTTGIRDVVLTMGAKGYCHISKGEILCEESIHVQVVDTTAAGDTFCGALATILSQGKAITEALHFANKAAAITVTRKGAQCAIPTYEEVL